MARMHPDMAAALASGRCLPFLMIRLDLPAPLDPLALLYGSGELVWDGVTFRGTDDKFGTLASIDPPEDGAGDNAPSMSIQINTPTLTAAADLASSDFQGSEFRLWIGTLADDGSIIGEPYLMFFGELDRPILSLDKQLRELDFEIVSAFERLFAATEGQRLSDASHQAVWPGELGYINVTGIVKSIIWGPGERPGGGASYNGSSGGIIGGGFGNNFLRQRNFSAL